MNETVDWVTGLVDHVNEFLSAPGPLRAVVFGLLLSWSGTQVLKFSPSLMLMADREHKLGVRGLAFALAALPVLMVWPGPWAERLYLAVINGLCAPTAYTLLVRVLYHFFPWLEPRLSAKPSEQGSGE